MVACGITSLQTAPMYVQTSSERPTAKQPPGYTPGIILRVQLLSHMSNTNVPDSISFEDLQSLMDTASETEQVDFSDDDALLEAALKTIKQAVEPVTERRAAVMHKAMVIHIINHMIEWHSQMAEMLSKAEQHEAAIGWARDAGKLQSICNILSTIEVDDSDFMVVR